jgi:hypothetical protein
MPRIEPFKAWKVGREWTWQAGEQERRAEYLANLPDGEWEMPACQRPKRSTRQNAYWWSTVLPILAAESGHTVDEMHDCLCQMFLPNKVKECNFYNQMTGQILCVDLDVRRSSKLTGSEFYDFVEQARAWGAQFLGVTTPDPDPSFWRKRLKRRALPASPELHS